MLSALNPRRRAPGFLIAFAALLPTPDPCHAQNYTWSATTGGSWTNATNWGSTPGDYPTTSANRAILSSGGNTSAKTVTLDSAITLRRLVFNSSQTGSVTIAPGAGGTLTLDSIETGQPTLDVQTGSGNHAITANMTLVGPIAHKWNIAANATLTVSGSISGSQGLTKLQAGTLLLNGTNTYTGATTVSAGTLGGSGRLASSVTVATGATITAGVSSSAPSLTLNNGLTLTGRNLVTLFSTNTASDLLVPSGLVTLNGGSLELALGSGVTVNGFRAGGPQAFTIIDAANDQLAGAFGPTNFTTAGFDASEWSVGYNPAAGNVTLNFTPVPEPGMVLGVAAVGLVAVWGVRRWLKRAEGPLAIR